MRENPSLSLDSINDMVGMEGGGRWKRVEFYKYILKQEFSFVKYTQLFKVYKKKVLLDLSLFIGN